MEENSTKEAKADDVGDSAEAKITKKVPPSYGSKAYWDQRYEKLLVADNDDNRNDDDDGSPAAETIKGSTSDKEANKHDSNNDNTDDDPVAFHSWYFTYDDLKPMILPLIRGGKEEVERRLGGTDDDDDININNSNNNNNNNVVSVTESSPQTLKAVSKSGEQDSSAEDKADNSEEDDDGWEEVEGDESDDSEEGGDEISQMEAGLVIEGPVAVLEVGCGDVPLVLGLADDLGKIMEAPTSKPTQPIVNRIVCTDYSATLIHTLERIHQKKRKLPGTSEAGDSGTASTIKTTEENPSVETNKLAIEYMVADARDLPFPDKSFHLILEKGTMDAMISDDEVGESNCIGIVSDCARVLATGGKKPDCEMVVA